MPCYSHSPESHDTGLKPTDVDRDRPEPLETPWGTFALFCVDGEILCVEAFCPHMLGPLFAGSVAEGQVTCPWHLWRYDLRSGRRVHGEGPADCPEARPLVRCSVEEGPQGTLLLRRPD